MYFYRWHLHICADAESRKVPKGFQGIFPYMYPELSVFLLDTYFILAFTLCRAFGTFRHFRYIFLILMALYAVMRLRSFRHIL